MVHIMISSPLGNMVAHYCSIISISTNRLINIRRIDDTCIMHQNYVCTWRGRLFLCWTFNLRTSHRNAYVWYLEDHAMKIGERGTGCCDKEIKGSACMVGGEWERWWKDHRRWLFKESCGGMWPWVSRNMHALTLKQCLACIHLHSLYNMCSIT
jgi:hypothetical protein